MVILERHVQNVQRMDGYWEREKQFAAGEQRIGGFPTKRYYSSLMGTEPAGTMVWEREWESLSAMEASYSKLLNDPELQSFFGSTDVVAHERFEVYLVETAQ